MARNQLVTDPTREHRVRERAYHLWEADGKPHGRDVEYWERARELVSTEESAFGEKPVGPCGISGQIEAGRTRGCQWPGKAQ